MAVRATGRFDIVRYDPGNPEFPVLPDGVIVPHLIEFGRSAGVRARVPIRTKRVLGAAPAGDLQRFAGWQTETTWVNPAIVDFGVIPSPVQRTVSLYNTRSESIEVTALTLPSGVTLLDSLPLTLLPFAGFTFTLEAATTGSNEFDEIVFFTTSEGTVPVRMIGRRVFTLSNIPETPITETLLWKTDILKSKDGTEKVYSLLRTPKALVDYKVKFRDDVQRAKFKNNFIAGASALVVAGQKWYEQRPLFEAVVSTDTAVRISNLQDSSWTLDQPISVVSVDGATVANGQLSSIEYGPDPDYLSNVFVARFDGPDGATTAEDLSEYANEMTFSTGVEIDTAEFVFGGSSLKLGTSHPTGVEIAHNPAYEIKAQDFSVQMWIRPTATDFTAQNMPMSYWVGNITLRSWFIQLSSTFIDWTINDGGTTRFRFDFSSPREIQANRWQYLEFSRQGNTLRCFVDGVQVGIDRTMGQTLESKTGDPAAVMRIGGYKEGSVFNKWQGHVDDIRMTIGFARNIQNYTPPTEPHPVASDTYYQLNLASELGAAFQPGAFVMPVGLGYISRFPTYQTHALNLEEADYQVTFTQEGDWSNLDTAYFPTLTDQQSPASTLPILEFKNELSGRTKQSQLQRAEDVLNSGLSNRAAFSVYPFADHVSEFQITLNNQEDVFRWRQFFHYLRGSYGEFYVPTFTNDLPYVTTAASNIFNVADTDLSLNFGNPPDPRRNAIRLLYPNGNLYYRFITQVIDNVTTEEVTVSSAVEAGSPFISYLQRCRILGDTVTFEHYRVDDVTIRFRYRTILI
jgi:hypothetical protein